MELINASGIASITHAYAPIILEEAGYTNVEYRPRVGRGSGFYIGECEGRKTVLGTATRRVAHGESMSVISPRGLAEQTQEIAYDLNASWGYLFAFALTDLHKPNSVHVVVADEVFLGGDGKEMARLYDDGRVRLNCNPYKIVLPDSERSRSIRLGYGPFPPF